MIGDWTPGPVENIFRSIKASNPIQLYPILHHLWSFWNYSSNPQNHRSLAEYREQWRTLPLLGKLQKWNAGLQQSSFLHTEWNVLHLNGYRFELERFAWSWLVLNDTVLLPFTVMSIRTNIYSVIKSRHDQSASLKWAYSFRNTSPRQKPLQTSKTANQRRSYKSVSLWCNVSDEFLLWL